MIAAYGATRRIPFLALAAAFLLGQVTWGRLGLPLGLLAVVTALTTVTGWVIGERRSQTATVLLLIAVSGLGGVRQALHWDWYESCHVVRLVDDVPRPMTLRGRIVRVDGPFSQNLGATATRESVLTSPSAVRLSAGSETGEPLVSRYRCWVEAIAVSRGRSWEEVAGRVEIWMPSHQVPLVGDQWRWTGTARRPPQAGNPRQYCRRTDLARRRLHVQLQVKSVEHAILETRATTSWAAFFSRWRQAARERIQRAIREPVAGLVSAMVLGRRQDLDSEVACRIADGHRGDGDPRSRSGDSPARCGDRDHALHLCGALGYGAGCFTSDRRDGDFGMGLVVGASWIGVGCLGGGRGGIVGLGSWESL